MSNAEWSARLSESYFRETGNRRAVRFPSEASFSLSGDDQVARMRLPAHAVTSNMQSNASAFESWSLALKRWCNVPVELSWEAPTAVDGSKHYERFLYRVERFALLFDDWFSFAGDAGAIAGSRLNTARDGLWLNVAGQLEKTHKIRDESPSAWTEDQWESHLASSHVTHLNKQFQLSRDAIKDQQFPVGLFDQPKPSAAAAIFPGAKSAIDIVALDRERLWIFELKKKGNLGFGALSELMFYTAVMRDAVCGRFAFAEPGSKGTRSKIDVAALRAVTEVRSVLLSPDQHPLIDDTLLSMLNAACARKWNGDGPNVVFSRECFDNDWAVVS